MGTYVSLVWDEDLFESIFKWTYAFDDELFDKHPELKNYGTDFDYKILKSFEKWLENLLFLINYAPKKWSEGCTWITPKDAIESINEDLKWIKVAYYKAKSLEIEGKNPRLSIG